MNTDTLGNNGTSIELWQVCTNGRYHTYVTTL
jgi:hypothetical protein